MYFRQSSVAIVFDDHKMFADTFSALLERIEAFQSVLSFSEENELMQFFIKNQNQKEVYFFVDYHLKDKHTISVINNARRLNKHLKVIVVTSTRSLVSIQNILSHEPDGFLSKSSGFEEMLACVDALKNNEKYICPYIAGLLDGITEILPSPFTTREIEILQYADQGYSVADIAQKISLSNYTVTEHRRHMMEKTNCKSITELLAFSRKRGII